MNSPSIPPVTAPATPKKKHGWGPYGWLAGIGMLMFLSLAAVVIWMMAVTCFYQTGLDKRREGDWNGAITQFTRVIRLSPRHAAAYYERGFAFVSRNDRDKAIVDFDKAIEIDPKNANAYCERGIARISKDQNDPAIIDFDRAIALDPKCVRAYFCRAVAYNNKGVYDKAIADYTRAIELDPRCGRAYRSRGAACCEKGDYDKAIADLDKGIELDPKDVRAYYWRGFAHNNKGDYDEAIADYTRAIELAPKDGLGNYYRACVYSMQHRWSDALADFQRSCELANPKMQDYARLNLWVVRSQLGQKEAGDKELAAYFGQRGKVSNPWPARIADFLLGKTRESDLIAAAALPSSHKERDQRAEGWYYAGMKRLLSGDKTGAADCFRKCMAIGRKEYSEYHSAQAELKALGL